MWPGGVRQSHDREYVMFVSVNWLAAVVAALATFLVGGPWYRAFGKRWNREMAFGEGHRGGHPARVFGLAYVFSLFSTVCLSGLLGPHAGAVHGLTFGAIVGLCLVAASFGVNYQFGNRSFVALAIDGGYHTIQFAVFGLVLGAWPA
jgi:hypothetical protein